MKDRPVRLTPKEFELLRYLVANQGRSLGHRRLLQAVWGPDYGDETEYLRVFINQLRKKIEPDPRHPLYIHTEPWVGYRFEPPAEKGPSPAPGKVARPNSLSAVALLVHRTDGVQIEIEIEYIHARLAQKSKLPPFRVLLHERPHVLLAHSALVGHARNLKLRRRRRNVRIEARSGSGHKVRRNRRIWIRRLQGFNAGIDAVNQGLVRGTKIRATRRRGSYPAAPAAEGRE